MPNRTKRKKESSLPRGVYERKVGKSTYWLVSLGRDPKTGKQKWKSCKSQAEAVSVRNLHEHAKQQEGEGLWTFSADQRADAVVALDILKDWPDATLVAAATHYRDQFLKLESHEAIAALVDRFLTERTAEAKGSTAIDWRYRLKSIKKRWGHRLPGEVTVDDVKQWDAEMRQSGLSPQTRKHALNGASSFWRWCVAHHYTLTNPLDPAALKRPKVGRREIKFFTVEQCQQALKAFAGADLYRYVALGLFCGIRPEETRRLRSKHFIVDGDTIIIRLTEEVTKTGQRVLEYTRGDTVGDCVWAWLAPGRKLDLPEKLTVAESTFKRRFADKVRPKLGFKWIQDGLRHSAATYHYSLGQNEAATSAMLGHITATMLRTHYRGLTTQSEAKKFYALRPELLKDDKSD